MIATLLAAVSTLGVLACGDEDDGRDAKPEVEYLTQPNADFATDPYCGPGGDNVISDTSGWQWYRTTEPGSGDGLLLCAGSTPNDRSLGVLYFQRDYGEPFPDGEEPYVIVTPDSGPLRITKAPDGRYSMFKVQHANLPVRAEDGRRGTLRLTPDLDEYRLDLQGEIYRPNSDTSRAIYPEQFAQPGS